MNHPYRLPLPTMFSLKEQRHEAFAVLGQFCAIEVDLQIPILEKVIPVPVS